MHIGFPTKNAFGTFAPAANLQLGSGDWLGTYPFHHEFGHELLYYLTDNASYMSTYTAFMNSGINLNFVFDFQHSCHPGQGGSGCTGNHGYNDGWAHFVYQTISTNYLTIQSSFDPIRRPSPLPVNYIPEGEESQVAALFKKMADDYTFIYTGVSNTVRGAGYLKQLVSTTSVKWSPGIVYEWNNSFKAAMTSIGAKQRVIDEAYNLYINLPN